MKWVYVLMLLEQNPETGANEWKEVERSDPVELSVCAKQVVNTVVTLEGWAHQTYCEEYVEDEPKEDK